MIMRMVLVVTPKIVPASSFEKKDIHIIQRSLQMIPAKNLIDRVILSVAG